MKSLEDILKYSRVHYLSDTEEGKQLLICNNKIVLSAVGGFRGVRGDFVETFEVAIIDKSSGHWVTNFYLEESDDVVSYMKLDDLLNLINMLFSKGFQVLPTNELGGGNVT